MASTGSLVPQALIIAGAAVVCSAPAIWRGQLPQVAVIVSPLQILKIVEYWLYQISKCDMILNTAMIPITDEFSIFRWLSRLAPFLRMDAFRAVDPSRDPISPISCGEYFLGGMNSMYVCMVITYSRVWINRVRLPILLVVS